MELKQLAKQQKTKGVLVKTPAYPSLVIMAQDYGTDFILYDCEYGVLSYEQLHDLMMLGNMRKLSPIVRVAQLARSDVSRTPDYGVAGVIVPMTEAVRQAEQLVQWGKHPPLGERSYSGGANTHYALGGSHALHMKQLNEKTTSIIQIETERGVENIEVILNMKGTDGVLTGSCDLTTPLGRPDDPMYEEELNMIQKVVNACLKRALDFGIIGDEVMQEYFKKESNLLVSAIDTVLMWGGLKQATREYEQLERT